MLTSPSGLIDVSGVVHAGAQLLLHAGKLGMCLLFWHPKPVLSNSTLGLPFRAKTKAFRDKALIVSYPKDYVCNQYLTHVERRHGLDVWTTKLD